MRYRTGNDLRQYITKHRTLPVRSKMWQSQYLLPRSQCLLSKDGAYLLKPVHCFGYQHLFYWS